MNESSVQLSEFSVPAVSSLWVALAGFGLASALPCAIAGWEPGSVGLVAVLLGIVGLIQTWRRPVRGKDTLCAAAGIILGIALVGMCLNGAFGTHRSPTSACCRNLSELGKGVHLYMQDHGGRFPPPESWNSAVAKYSLDDSLLYCPEAGKSVPSFAMNRRLAGLTIEAVADSSGTVMIFESVPGSNLFGGPALLPSPARHDFDGPHYGVLFCDGHVRMVDEKDLGKLNWDPEKKGEMLY